MKNESTGNPKRRKKIITAISTMLLSMLLLVSVTYAWFTLTNKPKIEGFMLKVGTTGSLKISNTNNVNDFNSSIAFDNMEDLCLKPLTSLDGQNFYKPSLRNDKGEVSAVSQLKEVDLVNITNKTNAQGGYIIKKTFWLLADIETKKSAEIKLVAGTKNKNNVSGTYIYSTNASSNIKDGSAAVRVSLVCNGETVILEPNYDVTDVGDTTQYKLKGWTSEKPVTIKQLSNGNFKEQTDGKSKVLFSIPAKKAIPVDMYIWLEGADEHCVNEIQGSEISYNFQFVSDDIE